MSNPSGGWFVTKQPQYIEESILGTFPTNPDMKWLGAIESWDPRADVSVIEIRQLGSEDPYKLLKGNEVYEVSLEYFLQNSTFAKYGILAQGGGAGSIDKSLSLAAGIKMDGVGGAPYYYKMLGCRTRSVTITGRTNEPLRARQELVCREIPEPSTVNPVGTGSWASDPGIAPWTYADGGLNPVTVASAPVPCVEMAVTVERNPESLFVLGSTKLAYLPPKHRAITATMTLVWLSQSRYSDMAGWADRTVIWTLKSGISVITLNNCKFHRLDSFTIRPTEVILERWAITALSGSIS